MSATNVTTYYEFPVFVGSDKPAWLVDWNGAMNAIDSAIHEAKAEADANATNISSLQSDVTSLAGSVSSQGSSITSLTQSLTSLQGTVNTITSLIGNGEPTTQDKTIIGAINELKADIDALDPSGQGVQAENVGYDNTDSGLTATNVQDAIDELAQGDAVEADNVSYDNTQSGLTATNVQDAIDELAQGGANGFSYVGEQTGGTALSVPSTAKEILVYVQYALSGGTVPCCSVAHFLTAMGKVYIDGGGYYGNTQGFYTRVGYDNTTHEVQLFSAQSDGSSVVSTTKIIVYAK